MKRTKGHTLIELLVVVASLVTILWMIFSFGITTTTSQGTTTRMARLQAEGRRALDALAQDLRLAGRGSLLVSGTGDSLEFRIPNYANGTVSWSEPIEVSYDGPAPTGGKKSKGGGGKKQEYDLFELEAPPVGRVVARAQGIERVLCNQVVPGGFVVEQDGANVAFTVTLQMLDTSGHLLSTQVRTSVTLRNEAVGGG